MWEVVLWLNIILPWYAVEGSYSAPSFEYIFTRRNGTAYIEPLIVPLFGSEADNSTVYVRNENPRLMNASNTDYDLRDLRRDNSQLLTFTQDVLKSLRFGQNRRTMRINQLVQIPDQHLAMLHKMAKPEEVRECILDPSIMVGCNHCVCMGGQLYVCTVRNCEHNHQPRRTRSKPKLLSSKNKLLGKHSPGFTNEAVCIEGEHIRSFDRCNHCYCGGGQVLCTRKKCETDFEVHNNRFKDCSPGDKFPSPDNCNSCACNNRGIIVCTVKSCGPKLSPNIKDKVCIPNSWFSMSGYSKCRECYCINGKIAFCYMKLCVDESKGKRLMLKLSAPGGLPDKCKKLDYALDKCTKCYCNEKNVWICSTVDIAGCSTDYKQQNNWGGGGQPYHQQGQRGVHPRRPPHYDYPDYANFDYYGRPIRPIRPVRPVRPRRPYGHGYNDRPRNPGGWQDDYYGWPEQSRPWQQNHRPPGRPQQPAWSNNQPRYPTHPTHAPAPAYYEKPPRDQPQIKPASSDFVPIPEKPLIIQPSHAVNEPEEPPFNIHQAHEQPYNVHPQQEQPSNVHPHQEHPPNIHRPVEPPYNTHQPEDPPYNAYQPEESPFNVQPEHPPFNVYQPEKTPFNHHQPEESPSAFHPKEPPFSVHPQEPPFSDHPHKPPFSAHPQEPPFSDHPHEPPFSTHPQEPPFSDHPHEPPFSAHPQEPPFSDHPHEPPFSDHPQEPPFSDHPQEPPLNDHSHNEPPFNTQPPEIRFTAYPPFEDDPFPPSNEDSHEYPPRNAGINILPPISTLLPQITPNMPSPSGSGGLETNVDRGPRCLVGQYMSQSSNTNCQSCLCTSNYEWKCWSVKGACRDLAKCNPGRLKKNPKTPCSVCYCGMDHTSYCATDETCSFLLSPSRCEAVSCMDQCSSSLANFGICHQNKCICIQ